MRCVILAACVFSASALSAAEKPNIIVFLSDDQGWGDLSCNGNRNLKTPHIDSLARDGARFDRFFVCPVCSPTRAEFLTGRYHARSNVFSTSAGGERMDLDEMTIAQSFKAAGYATGAFGKWHNGMQYPYHPNGRGFDEYYGFCSGHWGNYFDPMLEHNGKIVKGNGFCIDDFTDKAMAFIRRNKKKPFLAYLPYNTPHSPMQVPDRFWKKFAGKELGMRNREPNRENLPHVRAALAMCENIDWNVGRMLKLLDELKLRENTIVVYFCDNGPNGWRWNAGMKGRKGSTDEGGVRSPLLIRWPKKIESGTQVKQVSGVIDLFPTLADLAGIKVISRKKLDGMSLKPLLMRDTDVQWPDRLIFSQWRNRASVRSQRFRLGTRGKLFDMVADPGQKKDVRSKHPKIYSRLKNALAEWKAEMAKESRGDRPFVVGHANYKYTQLPARDAKVTGGIKRSNRFPNCSFYTNWTKTDETISFDAEVLADGEFRAEVYYTCPAPDVGSTIELGFNGSKVAGKVTSAHDPPLIGARQDRVKRGESYVKDFKPMSLGTITLKKGRGKLTLRALKIPGKQAMEFRLLMLTRVK